MNTTAINFNIHSLKKQPIPSILPLIFDRHVVETPLHWIVFLTAGALSPAFILIATHFFLPHRSTTLTSMTVELYQQPVPKPITPKLSDPPEKPEQIPPSTSNVKSPNLKARAGKVIAADSHAPTTQTAHSYSIVTGENDTYAGGDTTSSGTNDKPVETVAKNPPPPPVSHTPPVDVAVLIRDYLAQIKQLLEKEKHYPLTAQRLGIKGTVVVSFIIMADGQFDQVRVVSSSGSDLLDAAAIEAVHNLSGKVERPKATGTLPLPVKTALRFEIEE